LTDVKEASEVFTEACHRWEAASVISDSPIYESFIRPLSAGQLYRPADLSALSFTTTADLQPANGLAGQTRAADAIRFGSHVERSGFNLFVIGPNGARMQQAVKEALAEDAKQKPTPPDWVYVNNFAASDRPIALQLPAGRARTFHDQMHKLIDDLKTALAAVFQSEDYQQRRGAIDEAFQKKQNDAFSELRTRAAEKGVLILRTPLGFALAPARDGQVIPPDEVNAWPAEKRKAIQSDIETFENDLERIIHQIPQWEEERRDELRRLNREVAAYAVDRLIHGTKAAFSDLDPIIAHIDKVRADLVENIEAFINGNLGNEEAADPFISGDPFDRYKVNVLVTQNEQQPGAPVIEELHPTLGNLLGRIEHLPLHGALVTNFRLIKAGAIHRANGGYLLLDARSILTEPFSWAALKRTLRRSHILIEDVAQLIGLTSTVSLEPDPIPLDVRVVLFGDRFLYFLLSALDPELSEHFKVLADFENDTPRTPENEAMFARILAAIARRHQLRPLDREAVALVLEHSARLAGHSARLSLLIEQLHEVLIESDFCARQNGGEVITRPDVERALDARIQRMARLRDRMQEAILDKVALIATDGVQTGQINGLSVTELGGFCFGHPTRITCQVRPGAGKVVDIEREVELGGPIHSKGVLILSGYLAGRYALDVPMSLFASLVFEQSYGGVEGDSASSAELYALLSAIADVPLRQDLAVTGSVNQHGHVQAIGGVNEKIEGFFDICRAKGLTGEQGVLIPQANVQHLMLRQDVVEACAAGRFAVYPIATIDEGISLLTGLDAGMREADGGYSAGSLNAKVEDRLRAFASIRKSFSGQIPGRGPE
jgi:lon-related putative ATP-dependent protease